MELIISSEEDINEWKEEASEAAISDFLDLMNDAIQGIGVGIFRLDRNDDGGIDRGCCCRFPLGYG